MAGLKLKFGTQHSVNRTQTSSQRRQAGTEILSSSVRTVSPPLDVWVVDLFHSVIIAFVVLVRVCRVLTQPWYGDCRPSGNKHL